MKKEEVLKQLACSLGKRDDKPNQELAARIAEKSDKKAVTALAELMESSDANIASDSLKALYECGYLAPELLVPYVDSFYKALSSKNNRLVWGSMIAISCIAGPAPADVWKKREMIIGLIESGSVITRDAAVKALTKISDSNKKYAQALVPVFINVLKKSPVKDVPKYAEEIFPVLPSSEITNAVKIVSVYIKKLSTGGAARLNRLIKKYT